MLVTRVTGVTQKLQKVAFDERTYPTSRPTFFRHEYSSAESTTTTHCGIMQNTINQMMSDNFTQLPEHGSKLDGHIRCVSYEE